MPKLVLELVRDPSGFLTNVVNVDPKTIYRETNAGGYVQVINDIVVQYFKETDLVVAGIE